MATTQPTWSPASWRERPALHQPDWPDPAAAEAARERLSAMPPLVFAGEARRLRESLAQVAAGRAFLLQAGDCAESFHDFSAVSIREKLKVILQMAAVLTYGSMLPVVNPARMVQGYHQSASTLNLLRAFTKGGFADLTKVHLWNQEFVASSPEGRRYEAIALEIERALRFMAACGIDLEAERNLHEVDVWTSHEGLLLDYEQGLTRRDSLTGDWYDCSAHMLWIGERTRAADGAHVAFFAGVHNPIGVKLGPTATAADVTALCEALNPGRIPGRLTLIVRMGAGRVEETLPPLLRAARQGEHPIVWVCDPMHANMFKTESGYKTRRFEDILSEIQGFFAACLSEGAWPGGVHLEFTGEHVTECLGGSEEVLEDHLDRNYATLCDPRLNARQSLDLAFRVAELMRAAEERGAPHLP